PLNDYFSISEAKCSLVCIHWKFYSYFLHCKMGEVAPASFADVTFALIQKVSPRKLKRSDIPNEAFDALREMVSNELSLIPVSLTTHSPGNLGSNGNFSETVAESHKLPYGSFEDEDSRISGCESSEGSQSQYSIEDDLTKSLAKGSSFLWSFVSAIRSLMTSDKIAVRVA
ncbi:hypothetical protein GCK32_009752, partial [Trichostrongylus colubriformis]